MAFRIGIGGLNLLNLIAAMEDLNFLNRIVNLADHLVAHLQEAAATLMVVGNEVEVVIHLVAGAGAEAVMHLVAGAQAGAAIPTDVGEVNKLRF